MRWLVLPLTLLVLTGAGAGYGDIGAPRDTDPLTLAKAFCAARLGNGDMSPLARWYAPKLRKVLDTAAGAPVPWQSRDLKPLDRYFPEVHEVCLAQLPPGCVIDGEIVIATPRGLDFDALQLRLHPAASRVARRGTVPSNFSFAPRQATVRAGKRASPFASWSGTEK